MTKILAFVLMSKALTASRVDNVVTDCRNGHELHVVWKTRSSDQDSASDLTTSSSFNESFEDDFSEDEQSNVHATKTSSGTSNQECPVSFFTFGDTPRAYSRALRNGNDNESPPPLLLPSPTSTAQSSAPKQNEGISPKKRFMDRCRQTSWSDQYAEQRGMDVEKNS
jgi:hypothetical protein